MTKNNKNDLQSGVDHVEFIVDVKGLVKPVASFGEGLKQLNKNASKSALFPTDECQMILRPSLLSSLVYDLLDFGP